MSTDEETTAVVSSTQHILSPRQHDGGTFCDRLLSCLLLNDLRASIHHIIFFFGTALYFGYMGSKWERKKEIVFRMFLHFLLSGERISKNSTFSKAFTKKGGFRGMGKSIRLVFLLLNPKRIGVLLFF